MNQESDGRNFTRTRHHLILLVAVILCAILIASLFHPTAATIYPECKICKFIAHIFLSGTVASHVLMLPYFTGVIHNVECSPCSIVFHVIAPRSFAHVYFVSAGRIIIPSIVAAVAGCRAPPFKSIQ
jgi:hypothetical protein